MKDPAISGPGRQLMIYIGERDRWQGGPLYHAIVRLLKDEGLAGATVLRAIEGFGANSRIRTSGFGLSTDLPLVIIAVDSQEYMDRVIPRLKEMIRDGMMTIRDVEVLKYSHGCEHGEEHDRGESDAGLLGKQE